MRRTLFALFCCGFMFTVLLTNARAESFVNENAYRSLYFHDGRVASAISEDSEAGKIIARVDCVDQSGSLLWSCATPPSIIGTWTDIMQATDGTIVFLGETTDRTFFLLFISQDGVMQRQLYLPEDTHSPRLVSDRVVCATRPSSDKEANIITMDWTGNIAMFSSVKAKSISVFRATVSDNFLYLAVHGKDLDEKEYNSVVCISEGGELIWRYDTGSTMQDLVRAWANNDKGGVTLAIERHKADSSHGATHIVCIDNHGTVVWEREISHRNRPPIMHLFEQTSDGNYTAWGSSRIDASRNCFFTITLDNSGNLISSNVKAQEGDCIKYLDGEVYAVVYIDGLPSYIAAFTDLESITSEVFDSE